MDAQQVREIIREEIRSAIVVLREEFASEALSEDEVSAMAGQVGVDALRRTASRLEHGGECPRRAQHPSLWDECSCG